MAPRGGGAEGCPERADLYSMQQWCPLAGEVQIFGAALFFQVMGVSASALIRHGANDSDTLECRRLWYGSRFIR